MQECRKEMPVEDDYMMVIIPCIAEIAASDTPERVKKLRLGAVSELQRYLHYYRQLGYAGKGRRTDCKTAAGTGCFC